jgi:hypothetical protein
VEKYWRYRESYQSQFLRHSPATPRLSRARIAGLIAQIKSRLGIFEVCHALKHMVCVSWPLSGHHPA